MTSSCLLYADTVPYMVIKYIHMMFTAMMYNIDMTCIIMPMPMPISCHCNTSIQLAVFPSKGLHDRRINSGRNSIIGSPQHSTFRNAMYCAIVPLNRIHALYLKTAQQSAYSYSCCLQWRIKIMTGLSYYAT
jgi:hypothetical protein